MWKRMVLSLLLASLPWAYCHGENTVPADMGNPERAEAAAEKWKEKEPPLFEIHGDYRWLYGVGRFNGKALSLPGRTWKRQDEKVQLETRRFRLFPVLRLAPHLLLKTALEDNRIDEGPGKSHHLFLSRAYLQYEKDSFKVEAGRFNYFLMDGDILDKKVDGIRIRNGQDNEFLGRSTFFYGRTAEHRSWGRKAMVLENKRTFGKWLIHGAYADFKAIHRREESIPALSYFHLSSGKSGQRFDRQQIGVVKNAFSPNEDWTFSLDYILSHGCHEKDGYSETKSGYVAAALYGDADPRQVGSYEIWVRYYDLPSSALLAPTMDADTTFFRRMGFTGWGARFDFVPVKGLVWALEGFSLKNRSSGTVTEDFHEYVLGTSVTAYF